MYIQVTNYTRTLYERVMRVEKKKSRIQELHKNKLKTNTDLGALPLKTGTGSYYSMKHHLLSCKNYLICFFFLTNISRV